MGYFINWNKPYDSLHFLVIVPKMVKLHVFRSIIGFDMMQNFLVTFGRPYGKCLVLYQNYLQPFSPKWWAQWDYQPFWW